LNIYFATWMEDNQGVTLTNIEANKRLLSYFFLREIKSDFLKKYVELGKVETIKEKK